MLELLLSSGRTPGTDDDSDIPFAPDTPFKGIVTSASFITGEALATQIGLNAGVPFNTLSGWLHFIEASGLELLIAKKPLRHTLSWEHVNTATSNGAKEVTIGGEVYICRNITGAIATTDAATPANAGGEWNRYMYNVYDQSDRAGISEALLWGSYTEAMLGIATLSGGNDLNPGVFTMCAETLTNGYCLRGNDWQNSSGGYNIKGIWNQPAENPQIYYGWRPILIKKSTLPASPFKGEVLGADLITGAALVAAVGVTTGTVYDDGDPTWLKFEDNGKVFYIAKTPLRTGVTWEILNGFGAVYGTKTISIAGKQYKVRLMTGGNADPATVGGGEYDQYFARCTTYYTGASADRYANYSGADVGWSGGSSNGELSLCQEMYNTSGRLTRGYPGFNGLWYQVADTTHGGYGWRPVLEEVPAGADLFYGEVASADFITAAALTTAVGMGSNGSVTNADVSWLKFRINGKTLYTPKKPLRHGVTWNGLNALGLVLGTQTVVIGGLTYKVRLPTGAAIPSANVYDPTHMGGDFNNMIYPVYGGVAINHAMVQAYPRLAAFTDAELGLNTVKTPIIDGGLTLCQELTGQGGYLVRGYNDNDGAGIAQLVAGWYVGGDAATQYIGWRPILELVP